MYSILKIKNDDKIILPIDVILTKSIKNINTYDRNNYKIFFEAIEKFIEDNNLIIGGAFASMLLYNEINMLNYTNMIIYEIYTEEPKEDAIKLANILYNINSNGISRYTYVFPKIQNNLYQIFLNARPICTFKKIPIYKGVNIEYLIVAQVIKSIYLKNNIICMGNYIQLINLYADINNPILIEDCQKNLLLEHNIRKKYIQNIKNDIIFHKKLKLNQILEQKNQINMSFIYTYINNSNKIIIGDVGLYLLKNNKKKIHYNDIKKFRLQVLTCNALEDDGKLLNIIGKTYNLDIQWAISMPKYIDDFYLKRLTAYIMVNGHKRTILDIFNYGEYNIIGYNTISNIDGIKTISGKSLDANKLKYGSIFILMRFRLIDEWILNLLYELKSLDESAAKSMIIFSRNGFVALSEILDSISPKILTYLNELEYIGTAIDVGTELKRKSVQSKYHVFSAYYPVKPNKYKLF